MPLGYTSPGAAFGSAFDEQLMQNAQQEHQAMMDDLARKREQRMAQAELDSMHEKQDALAQKKQDAADKAHESKVKDLEKRASNMVKGDRPDPEMLKQDQELGTHLFVTAPPAMSTETMQPPAALMPNAPAGAPAEGADIPTAPGAMAPGPTVYPGSPQERQKDVQKADVAAFVQRLRDSGDTQRADEIANMYEAEGLGLKPPAGMFSKAGAAGKTRLIFDPIKRQYTDPSGKVVTDVPDNAAIDRAAEPKDTSGREAAAQNHLDTIREHAYTELNNRAKPIEEQISNLNKLDTALNEDSNIADSTLAEQIIKVTAGGAGSGVRITMPEIDQVLKRSRTKWDDLKVALNRWATASPDQKQQDLFYTPEQKQAMRDLVKAFRTKANKLHKQIIDTRHAIDDASDVNTINKVRTRAEEDIFAEPTPVDTGTTSAKPLTVDDVFAKFGKPPGAK